MASVCLVLGGCRSGKSSYALGTAQQAGEPNKVFIATCPPLDKEMRARIERHRSERGRQWRTVEAQQDLPGAIRDSSGRDSVLLVDCLGMWMNNLLDVQRQERDWEELFQGLCRVLQQAEGRIFVVSNEVGCGLVPADEVSRMYRDGLGRLNQEVAAIADRVIWMVAGLPVTVKEEE